MPFDHNKETSEPAPQPKWGHYLDNAYKEGQAAIRQLLAEVPKSGVTFWISTCAGIEFGRDTLGGSGEVLLRITGMTRVLSARELGVLSGMFGAAAMIQGELEDKPDDGDQF